MLYIILDVRASPIASSQANMQPVPATQVEQRPLITMEIESLPALLPSLKSQSLSASQVHHAYSPEMVCLYMLMLLITCNNNVLPITVIIKALIFGGNLNYID